MYLQIALHNSANAHRSSSASYLLNVEFIGYIAGRISFYQNGFSFISSLSSFCHFCLSRRHKSRNALLANRRSSSNRAPSSIFFGLRRTQRCPRYVYPIIVMSSVSRFIRPRREWSGCDVPPARPIRASTTRAVIVHSGKLHFLRVVATELRILRRRRVYNIKVCGIRWKIKKTRRDFSAYFSLIH